MNNLTMKQKLEKAGIPMERGMTAAQLDRAEAVFGFRFPREIREFLSRLWNFFISVTV